MTYEFTTYDGREGIVTIDDETGRIESGTFIFGEHTCPIEFLEKDLALGLNAHNFRTITAIPKE